jgi:mycobactin phenyloxazoline synthetase
VTTADLETIRAGIAALLGIDHETVDPDRELIAQGLDSIRMMGLAGRWRCQGVDVDFARLGRQPVGACMGFLVGVGRPPVAHLCLDTIMDSCYPSFGR